MREFSPGFAGSTCVEIGSGSMNPMGLCLVLLMAGARRAIAIDLDPVQDDALACRALAGLAAQVVIDASTVFGEYPVTAAAAMERLGSFDLGLLQKGLASGIDGERLSHRCESVCRLSLADAEADFVFSNAFLEHVDDTDGAIRELARVTRRGGIQVHCIDTSDHCRYTDESLHPLEFLKVETSERFVHTSNRLRLFQFMRLFEQHGFEILRNEVTESVVVEDELRKTFAEPFRSMSRDDLSQMVSLLVLRKSGS
jgi:SAM-dependent methyltransferase